MITRLDIKGFKSIKEQEVALKPINILIGGNGVGKSNFISIFSFVRAIYEANLKSYIIKKGGANNILYFGAKVTEEIYLDFYFGDSNNNPKNRFIVTLENAQDSLSIRSVGTAFYNGLWHSTMYENNVLESDFKNINRGQAYWVNPRLKEFEVYHFHDTGDNSPMKGYSKVDDNEALKKDGSNIASFLYYLKQKHHKHYLRIESSIRSIAPFFGSFILEPSKLNEDTIKLKWNEKGDYNSDFDAYNFSDGTLRYICLATLLMQPEPPKTIIIDEPELGLHPAAINKFSALVRKASIKSQLIISTQSANLVDNFDPDDIIIADRKTSELGVSQTVFRRLANEELKSWLDDYSLSDVWGKNIFGGQPF